MVFLRSDDQKKVQFLGISKVLESLGHGVLECWSIEKKASILYPILQFYLF